MTVIVATKTTGNRLGSTITVDPGSPTGATINQGLLGGVFGYADVQHRDPLDGLVPEGGDTVKVRRIDGMLNYTPIKAGAPDGTHPTAGHSGSYSYDWTILDAELDSAAAEGVTEFYISLNYCPQLLGGNQAPSTTAPFDDGTWYRGPGSQVPNDPAAFATMSADTAHHVTVTKGVNAPRWCLWNEPDIFYWGGTAEQYFDLYAAVAVAIKAIDSDLKVGGPEIASLNNSKTTWVEALLTYCIDEDIPLDFLSWHVYEAHAWDLGEQMRWIAEAIDNAGWATPLETVIGEWTPFSPAGWPGFGANPWQADTERPLYDDQGAAYTAKFLMELQHHDITRAFYFCTRLTDTPGISSGLFADDAALAPGNVYRMWDRIGAADVLDVDLAADSGIHAIAAERDGTIYVLVASHHYRPGTTYPVTVNVDGVLSATTTLSVIDRDRSNKQNAGLDRAELETVPIADLSGGKVRFTMAARAVCLLEIDL